MQKKLKNTLIKTTINTKNPPFLSEDEKASLARLEAMTDDEIDYSDAPYNPNAEWVRAVDFSKDEKKGVYLKIDSKVLDFFKKDGKGYQSRINEVLRAFVAAQED